MVILLILGMLILLLAFATQLTDASAQLHQFEEKVRLREANYQVARSAVEMAMELLRVDEIEEDSAQDVWALGAQRLSWEGREFFLEIRDEESRFPLRKLPLDDKASPDQQGYVEALQRLLNRNGLAGEIATATLQDWMDADDLVRSSGAEQGNYPRLLVKNGFLDSLDELDHLIGWGPPQLPAPLPLNPAGGRLEAFQSVLADSPTTSSQSDWSDWLSAYALGKVNVNTAPQEVLASLDSAMSDSVVTELIAHRSREVLRSQEDLKKIPGIDRDLAFRLDKLVGYASKVFRIRVIVTSQSTPLELETMLERQSQQEIVVRYWRAR